MIRAPFFFLLQVILQEDDVHVVVHTLKKKLTCRRKTKHKREDLNIE